MCICGNICEFALVIYYVVMTVVDISALIALGESRTLELKKTTGELKDGMHAACPFLYS